MKNRFNYNSNLPKKRGRKLATFWNLFFSYTTILYAVVSGIVLVPLYLRYIPVDLYGAWLASGNILAWLAIVDPGIASVLLQRIGRSYGKGDKAGIIAYFNAGLVLTGAVCVVIVVVGVVLGAHISEVTRYGDPEGGVVLEKAFGIAAFGTALMVLSFSIGSANRALLGSVAPGLIVFFGNFGTIVLTIVLLLKGAGLYAIAGGLLFRGSFQVVGNLIYFFYRTKSESIRLSWDFSRVSEMLQLMSFTSLGKIGAILSRNMDAFLLARFMGPEAVPVFVLTRRGFNVAEMLLNRTGNAVGPGLSHLSGEGDREKLRVIVSRLLRLNLWILGLALGGFLAFNDDFVRIWVGESFFAGDAVSGTLCVLLLASVLVTLMQTLCVALGDIKRNALIQFGQALVTFTALLVGIHYFGLLGAALAPLVGFVAVGLRYYLRSLTKLSFLELANWKSIGLEGFCSLGLGLGLGLLMSFLPEARGWLDFIARGMAFASIYAGLLWLIRPGLRAEIKSLGSGLLRKWPLKKGLPSHA